MLADTSADRSYDHNVAPRPPISEEQLKAFLQKIKADTSLQDKPKAASDVDVDLAIAKEAGFSISADDLTKAQSEIEDVELECAAGSISPDTCDRVSVCLELMPVCRLRKPSPSLQ